MNEEASPSRGFLVARALCLLPYALVMAWPTLGATHALMLGLLGELLFPQSTRPLPMAVRHFVCWSLLRFAAPDPFAWWWGCLFLVLLVGSHRWWAGRPRLCGLLAALWLLVPLLDMGMRLDPESPEGAGRRNPWSAQVGTSQAGTVVLLDAPVLAEAPVPLVLPERAQPWYLLAGAKGKGRVGLILGFALVFGLIVTRRPAPFQMAMVFPLVLGVFLLRGGGSAEIWLTEDGERWQVLELDFPLPALEDGKPATLHAEFASPHGPTPGAPVSWVARGPLIAPEEGGEASAWPFLTHWADAKPQPGQFQHLESGSRLGVRRWEIDSEGVLVLRALP